MAITHRDMLRFFDALLASELNFGVWHVVSKNFWNRLDVSDTSMLLGYEPRDDAFVLAGKIKDPDTF